MRDEIIQKRGYASSTKGDVLSLKISSYPVTAKYLAERLAQNGNSICELCCGIGISLIEFSNNFEHVIGVDNHAEVMKSAQDNLQSAGVKNCELLLGSADDSSVLSKIKADIVAYDIPYWSNHDDNLLSKNPQLSEMIQLIKSSITENIVVYLPAEFSFENANGLADTFEYQEVWIDGKHDRNFIYFGNLIHTHGYTKVTF